MKYQPTTISKAPKATKPAPDINFDFAFWLMTKTRVSANSHIGALAIRWIGI